MPMLGTPSSSGNGPAFSDGTVDITAYGSANYCNGRHQTDGGDQLVYVNCYNASGAPADSKFTAEFLRSSAQDQYDYGNQTGIIAYIDTHWNNYPTVVAGQSHSTIGKPVQYRRTGVGDYWVTALEFASWMARNPTIKVTTTDASNVRCTLAGWNITTRTVQYTNGPPTSVSDLEAHVACWTATGARADSNFDLSMASGLGLTA